MSTFGAQSFSARSEVKEWLLVARKQSESLSLEMFTKDGRLNRTRLYMLTDKKFDNSSRYNGPTIILRESQLVFLQSVVVCGQDGYMTFRQFSDGEIVVQIVGDKVTIQVRDGRYNTRLVISAAAARTFMEEVSNNFMVFLKTNFQRYTETQLESSIKRVAKYTADVMLLRDALDFGIPRRVVRDPVGDSYCEQLGLDIAISFFLCYSPSAVKPDQQ